MSEAEPSCPFAALELRGVWLVAQIVIWTFVWSRHLPVSPALASFTLNGDGDSPSGLRPACMVLELLGFA